MEEDIFIVESFLKNKEMLLKHPCWVSEKTIQAIENLISKYKELEADIYSANCIINEYIESDKEQEKIIELMAQDIADITGSCSYELHDYQIEDCENTCTPEINQMHKGYSCFIDYYEKKAREENETN